MVSSDTQESDDSLRHRRFIEGGNRQQDFDYAVLSVIPVVQSFMQQRDRIADELWEQIQLSCCQYVLDHVCRYDDYAFPVNSKALAAEDTNIQPILFDSPTTQHSMEALITHCWHRKGLQGTHGNGNPHARHEGSTINTSRRQYLPMSIDIVVHVAR